MSRVIYRQIGQDLNVAIFGWWGGGGLLFSCVFANQHSWKNSCDTSHFPLSPSSRHSRDFCLTLWPRASQELSFPSLPPSLYLSLSTTQGEIKLHRQNAAFGNRVKTFCKLGQCHAKHIWKQFVSEAELVCPQSCFLLKCLCARCVPRTLRPPPRPSGNRLSHPGLRKPSSKP